MRRTGIYFSMLTFAFQMLLYTIALKATPLTGGDDGLTGLKPPGLLARPVAYYYFALVITSASLYVLYRVVIHQVGPGEQAEVAERDPHLLAHRCVDRGSTDLCLSGLGLHDRRVEG